MERLLIVQTGGTIDKDYPKRQSGYAFEITTPAVQRVLSKINVDFAYDILPLLHKDSSEITASDRVLIKQHCIESHCNKILITHGTDTMIETALFLSDIPNKTIVITGSFLPEKFKDSDADFNLGFAIGCLKNVPEGVYIAINACLFPANHCVRDSATGKFKKIIKLLPLL